MDRLRWISGCVQKWVRGATDRAKRLVRDVVVGMVMSGSVVLCEIARALNPSKRAFETIVHRLSQNLADQVVATEVALVARQYLADAGRVTWGEYEFVVVDLTDIVKKYGRKMPFLCTVRDGSASRPGNPKLERGWWSCDISATTRDHRVVPLYRSIWSTEHPSFRSETNELRKAIGSVVPFVSPRAIWLMDRAGDANARIDLFNELCPRWVFRMRGDRKVWRAGATDDGPHTMLHLARAMAKPYKAWCWVSRDNQLVRVQRRFGYLTIQLEPGGKWYTLLAVETEKRDNDSQAAAPVMLLTNIAPLTSVEGECLVAGYSRRWGGEDEIRAAKQCIDLENIRVLNWPAIVSLFLLSVVAQGLIALQEARAPRRAHRLAAEAPIVDAIPPYRFYRLWMRVQQLLRELAVWLRRWQRRGRTGVLQRFIPVGGVLGRI